MAIQWLRRTWLLAAASSLVLAACGGGDIVDSFTPARAVAFGDAMGDLGQTGSRYTVNDTAVNNWTQFVALGYGVPLSAAVGGGTSLATGNARVIAKPDAAGNSATPTVAEQIDTFLASGQLTAGDLVMVSAGTSDVIVQAQAVINNAQSPDQAVANAGQAGRDLAAQVRRLVAAGAKHVVVVGPYNLGRSPWATQTNQGSLLEAASGQFNQQLLVSMVDLGNDVLYVDAALEYNLLTANPSANNLNDATTVACTSRDPGPGIGTGANEVNSSLCNPSTIVAGQDYTRLLFADRVYPTPVGQRIFGDFALGRIRDRW